MLFSSHTSQFAKTFGIDTAVQMLVGAGFSAIDCTMFNMNSFPHVENYREKAKELRAYTDAHGVVFNQAHAPFGGGYENYTKKLVPTFPYCFEAAAILGIKNIIVHPLQNGRYYGNEEALFDANMEFYSKLIPLSKEYGVRIAIENMWQRHPVTGVICDDVCAPPEELNRYYDTLNNPEVFTICLDIGHVAICAREPERAIRTIGGERLGAIHAHDVDYAHDLHTLPGVGKIKWDNVCRALADVNYSGDFTLESEGFVSSLDPEQYPMAARYMAQTAKYLADKIERYKREK